MRAPTARSGAFVFHGAMQLRTGMTASRRFTVSDDDTAAAVGSGDLPVLGTPVLLAWCEAVTCAAVAPALDEASTSVGTRVDIEHLAASAVGAEVDVEAATAYVDGRLVRFTVSVREGDRLVGSGEVTRVVVDRERFLSRVQGA